jgi:hypothetical protein
MKLFFLFLAFSILIQAHDICVPGVCHSKKEKQKEIHCSSDITGKKTCCHTSPVSQNENENDSSCGGETCHCLGCLKVFITSQTIYFEIPESFAIHFIKNEINPVKFYFFHYSEECYHPP